MSMAEHVWGHNELEPMEEWNDHKQQHLARYVEDYADSLSDPSLFFQRIDWQHLLKTLDVHNLELLQLKVDELYDSRFSGFYAGDHVNIAEIVGLWKKKRNPLFREVARMIESLGLESFETDSPTSEAVSYTNTSNGVNGRKTSGSGTRPNLSRNPNTFQISRQEMPKMTKNQRRMSLDLMHSKSTVSDIMSGDYPRNRSLRKPAENSTTNVNVITKAEVSTSRVSTPNETSPLTKNRLKEVQKRFRFVLGSKSKSIDLPKLRNPNSSVSNVASKPVQDVDRKSRRLSLVGENLPLYIKKQLESSPRSTSVIIEPSVHTDEHIEDIESNAITTITTPSETTSVKKTETKIQKQVVKKKSRLQNLLTNSQSLYSNSKDGNSARSSLASSNISSSNKTSNTSAGGTPQYDSDEEDDNKEYISPDSLTRYYGMQADDNGDHEDILKELDENEDDIDFVNVNESYDVLIRRVADDDRSNKNHAYDDDDYLFKI